VRGPLAGEPNEGSGQRASECHPRRHFGTLQTIDQRTIVYIQRHAEWRTGLETFALTLLGIAGTVAVPLGLAWTNRHFVGQRTPPVWARKIAIGVAGCGLAWCAWSFSSGRMEQLRDQTDAWSLVLSVLAIAWVAGSCIAAGVALQEHGADK
jgi:hypothetical protein